MVGHTLGSADRPTARLVFHAHRLLYHPTLGLRVIKKKKKNLPALVPAPESLQEAREEDIDCQLTGPDPPYHRDDLVDRPRAMGV